MDRRMTDEGWIPQFFLRDPAEDDFLNELPDSNQKSINKDQKKDEEDVKGERVFAKRFKMQNGKIKIQYLMKWQNYDEAEATWQWADSLNNFPDCREAIEAYEEKHLKQLAASVEHKLRRLNDDKCKFKRKGGFELGLEPERILGAGEHEGETWLLVKWKDFDFNEFVRAKVANERCPQLVIQFYQRHLVLRDRQRA